MDRFKSHSTWALHTPAPETGPEWDRTDQQAYAGYLAERRWLFVMDLPCLARKFKNLPGNADKEVDISKP